MSAIKDWLVRPNVVGPLPGWGVVFVAFALAGLVLAFACGSPPPDPTA